MLTSTSSLRHLSKVRIKPTTYKTTKTVLQSFTFTSKSEEEDTSWKPPKRPLSGDKGNYYDEEEATTTQLTQFIDLSHIGSHIGSHTKTASQNTGTLGDVMTEEINDASLSDEEVRQLIADFERSQQQQQQQEDTDTTSTSKEGEEYEELNEEENELDEEKLKAIVTKVSEKYDEDHDEPIEMDIPDWMVTRRKKMKGDADLYLPPVLKHTLLSSQEIISCLKSLGGQNTVLISPTPGLGVDGMILTTGTTTAHNRHISSTLVKILRDRSLHKCDVVGAMSGAEGGTEGVDDDWIVVDCGSYAVQIMDEFHRKHLNLEELWDPRRRREVVSEEEFERDYAIPEEYMDKLLLGGDSGGDGEKSGFGGTVETMDKLKKSKWKRDRVKQHKRKARRN